MLNPNNFTNGYANTAYNTDCPWPHTLEKYTGKCNPCISVPKFANEITSFA